MATSDPAAVPIVIPQMGLVEEVVVVEWLVPDGAAVSPGEPVVAIDTDKAVVNIESPAAGRLRVLISASDREVPVGAVLGEVLP